MIQRPRIVKFNINRLFIYHMQFILYTLTRRLALSVTETNPLLVYYARLFLVYGYARSCSSNEEALTIAIIFRVLSWLDTGGEYT